MRRVSSVSPLGKDANAGMPGGFSVRWDSYERNIGETSRGISKLALFLLLLPGRTREADYTAEILGPPGAAI
jgi:hypothetical protein